MRGIGYRLFCGLQRTFCSSASVADSSRTSVVFLHFGQPKSEYYARQFAADAASSYYNIPDNLKSAVSASWLVDDRVRKCIDDYGTREPLEMTLHSLCTNVEEAVSEIVPEFGPVKCSTVFLFEGSSLETELSRVISSSVERVVFLPLYAHFHCARSGELLNAAADFLMQRTVSSYKDGQPLESVRIVPGTSSSFSISAIHRWGDHPVLPNLWWDHLKTVSGEYDAVLFVAPNLRGRSSENYRNSVWATAERVVSELDFVVPWDVGYYNGWEQWNLPSSRCIHMKGRKLAGKVPNARRVAVVPVTSFFPSFDTFSTLPAMVSKMDGAFLLPPPHPTSSPILSQGLAELIKNHLLGRCNAQLQLYCSGCRTRACECSRLLFAK